MPAGPVRARAQLAESWCALSGRPILSNAGVVADPVTR